MFQFGTYEKVDFFVRTQTPPLQGVFYDGQLWDARALVLKLDAGEIRRIKKTAFASGVGVQPGRS